MNSRFAYLIIAHNEFDVLKLLVTMLDDERNDIYVHIDKKVTKLPILSTSKSKLYVLDKRVDVRWGHVSQIETELLLFQTAQQNGPYAYYHLISGTHLPLKSQDYIHSFFDSVQGQEVMRVWPEDSGDADFKLRRFHLLRSFEKGHGHIVGSFAHYSWLAALKLQRLLGIRRRTRELFVKSDNWKSLTQPAVDYLVGRRKSIISRYRYSFCGDEYYAASELCKHKDRFMIHDTPDLLYVEFIGANPRTLTMEEFQELQTTEYLFARKFTK